MDYKKKDSNCLDILKELSTLIIYNKKTGKIYKEIGTSDRGYRRVHFKKKSLPVHLIVWFLETGRLPKGIIDHINGLPGDNKISNLRECSHSENSRNHRVHRLGKTPCIKENKSYKIKSWTVVSTRHLPVGEKISLGTYRCLWQAKMALCMYEEENLTPIKKRYGRIIGWNKKRKNNE